jgi:NTE family protein
MRIRSLLIGISLALSFAAPAPVAGAETVDGDALAMDETHSPRVALVLSGGGARGAAHLGVIQVLEEEGVPIDLVVGTSMGAIVGALYAAGNPVDMIEADFRSRDWLAQFTDAVDRQQLPYRRKAEDGRFIQSLEMGVSSEGFLLPRAVLGGRSLDFTLRRMLSPVGDVHDFDQLPIPFRAVATDLADGSVVVLGEGDLVSAVRASSAFPGGVAPVTIDDRTLVDGGLASNLPVEVARALGADIIIAVNIGSTVEPVEEVRDALDIASQVVAILTDRNVYDSKALLTEDDLYIEPPLSGFTSASFARIPRIIDIGRETAEAMRPQIAALAARVGRSRSDGVPDAVRVRVADRIEISGNERVDTRQIATRIETDEGSVIDTTQVHDDLDRIYSIGDFEQVEYHVGEEDGQTVLTYDVTEKYWGPYYLRGGLRVENDFSGTGDFSILASLRRSQLNARGGEWRTMVSLGIDMMIATELYQPLDFTGEWFFAPELRWSSNSILIQAGPASGTEFRHYRRMLAMDLGLTPRSYGEARIGIEMGHDRVSPRGTGGMTVDERFGRLVLDLRIDQLDDAYLPRDGFAATLRHDSQRISLGADIPYERTLFRAISAWSLSDSVVVEVNVETGSSHGDDIPLQDEFELGGLGRMSGLPIGALRGDDYALGRVVVHGPLLRREGTGSAPLRWGLSFEVGDAWDFTQSLSFDRLLFSAAAFTAVETPVGAIFFGYGLTESGETSLHLVLGRPF